MTETRRYPTRGFGSPNYGRARQRDVSSQGGRAAHAQGTAHEWNSATARAAARKGVLARAQKRLRAAGEGE